MKSERQFAIIQLMKKGGNGMIINTAVGVPGAPAAFSPAWTGVQPLWKCLVTCATPTFHVQHPRAYLHPEKALPIRGLRIFTVAFLVMVKHWKGINKWYIRTRK